MKRLSAIVALVLLSAAVPAAARWGEGYIPNLPVQTQDGRTVNFFDDLMKEKIVVLSFIYTSCRDICPVVTARLAQLEEKLGDAMNRDIFFVSISVDPETDTPERLKEYADAFQAGPGWTFVTGDPKTIRFIRNRLGDRGAALNDHKNEILLANTRTGDWERASVFGDINTLTMSVRAMDPTLRQELGRDQVAQQIPSSSATPLHASSPGQMLFAKACASCHTIGRGSRVGPDLEGVMTRRTREWVASYVKDPAALRQRKDPTALALRDQHKAVAMPRLGLSDGDVEDLVAFIDSRSGRGAKASAVVQASHAAGEAKP